MPAGGMNVYVRCMVEKGTQGNKTNNTKTCIHITFSKFFSHGIVRIHRKELNATLQKKDALLYNLDQVSAIHSAQISFIVVERTQQ